MSYSIGVDLGGTNIKIVVISNDGNVLEYLTCDTADTEGSWAQTIKDQLESIRNKRRESPCYIGLAAPGLAARDGRSIAYMQGRLPGLEGFVWRDFLDAPVMVLNDAHAALLGEVWQGAAKGFRNVILLTLGTGVGGAVLVEGRLIRVTRAAFDAYLRRITEPACDSTSAGEPGGAASTSRRRSGNAPRRSARTVEPPSSLPPGWSAKLRIPAIVPRTQRRSPTPSNDS